MRRHLLLSVVITLTWIILSVPGAVTASEQADTGTVREQETLSAYDNLKDSIRRSTASGYGQLMDGAQSAGSIPGGNELSEKIWSALFYFLDVVSGIYRFAMVTSISLGLLVYYLSPRNKKIQKFALRFLVIVLPVILSVFRYGIPVLYSDLFM